VPLEDQSGVVSRYAELVPQLASMARSMVRDLDPQNSLQFLRIRSKNHEIMVHSDPEFTLIVIQNPAATE
jgi:dynein light chain roadblock-type